ncbi:MAG: agmatine deiminase [Steroidobacteraceae bacterium]|jgi:agmatine deiminase|nr:agmatine deiminase [Steroidobacteraceae bacterium]
MSRTLDTRPARDGFRMPAEFEPHDGCWLLWPERTDNWRLGAKPAQAAFVQVAAAIAASEPVTVGVSQRQYANARSALPPAVRVVELSSNDCWMRDVGPTFVVDARGRRRGVDWRFNAWGGLEGGLYWPWDLDDAVAQKVCEIEGADRYRAPCVLEGGAIHADGQGTLLTTEECLLNPNRNPGLTREEIERLLADHLGIETVIWLGRGVYRDETDGHVDNLACFAAPGVVCLTWTDDRSDPQYEISRDAHERLASARDARGRRFEIHKLVQPGPLYMTDEEAAGVDHVDGTEPRRGGNRLAGSYVNFYVANRHVVMPLLDRKRDARAAAVLKRAFPKREVVGVPAREILLGGGNIHCITQQVPRPRELRSGRAAPRRRR